MSFKSTCIYRAQQSQKVCIQFSFGRTVFIARVMWLLTDGDQAQCSTTSERARMASASVCDDLLPPDWQ